MSGAVKETINYHESSIVSKEIFKSPSGSLSLFAFAKGQRLSEHQTPYQAFVLVLDGKAQIVVGGKRNSASEGEMVPLPTNIPHSITATSNFKMLLIMLKSD